MIVLLAQRTVLVGLNRKKERVWRTMSVGERATYQNDKGAREKDGNRRLDFRYVY